MTDQHDDTDDDTDDDTAVAPAQQADSFAALQSLLHVLANASIYEARLRELKAELSKVEKAGRLLARERIAHDAQASKDKAELEAQAAALRKREVEVHVAENRLADDKAEVAEFHRAQRSRNVEQLPGGMTREIDRGDPLYARPPQPAETEMEIEAAPDRLLGSTLTRSTPRRRSGPRRSAEL